MWTFDPADGSSCYDNPLHHSRAGRSTKTLLHHFVFSLCVSAVSCCSVYWWQLPKASFFIDILSALTKLLEANVSKQIPTFSLWLKTLVWNKTPENEDPPLFSSLLLFCNNRSSSPLRRRYFINFCLKIIGNLFLKEINGFMLNVTD